MSITKRALVTGASSGIGRSFAIALAEQGYAITAVARREPQLQALLEELTGQDHDYLLADLAEEEGVNAVCQALAGEHYQLLINNAGYSRLEPFYTADINDQQKILQVNCSALVSLAHAFLAQAEDGDALVNLSSVVAYMPTPAQAMYSASKAFIASFSECLWEEQRKRGVYVMALCPGVTETEFISTATGGESSGDALPAAFIQTADEVVGEAMAALRKRKKAVIVPGRVNRGMMALPHLLSRHNLLKLLAVIGDPEKALK